MKEPVRMSFRQIVDSFASSVFALLLAAGCSSASGGKAQDSTSSPEATLLNEPPTPEVVPSTETVLILGKRHHKPNLELFTGISASTDEKTGVRIEETYKEGDGVYVRSWYPNGGKEFQAAMRNGQPDGVVRKWHPNGNLKAVVTYKNGLSEGPAKEWHEDGWLKCEGAFQAGEMHGKWVYYRSGGAKTHESELVEGKTNGLLRAWDESGRLTNEIMYEDNEVVGRKKY